MKLFAYGDSWTEGQGVNPKKEESLIEREERKHFRNSKSWPKVLSDLIGCNHQNQSLSGSNNNDIFNSVINDIKSDILNSGDMVIIMWSSSLRDSVPFFPENEWHIWGLNYIKEDYKKKWFIQKDLTRNPTYNNFLINFKEFFIEELFTQDYYNIINQNYILFLQKLFEHYHINYIFCDAFDKMISNINVKNDKTNLINQKKYWEFSNRTFKDFLISTNNPEVWESPEYNILNVPGMHPSELGYKLIGEHIFEFINQNKNDIITYTNDKKIKIL
jgi:lysophospholipase L1-like esterase